MISYEVTPDPATVLDAAVTPIIGPNQLKFDVQSSNELLDGQSQEFTVTATMKDGLQATATFTVTMSWFCKTVVNYPTGTVAPTSYTYPIEFIDLAKKWD